MRLFCRIGWHNWVCYGSRLGDPWVFNMRCTRCHALRDEARAMPPQPPSRHRPEPHPDFSDTSTW